MKNFILFILLSITFSFTLNAGGPWPQKKGKAYIKLSEWGIRFNQHYTDTGKKDPNITTGIYNTFLYGEYGISHRATGIFNGALFSRNTMNNLVSNTNKQVLIPGEAINSIGDIDVGLKYLLSGSGSRVAVSASLILGLPTGVTGRGAQGNLQTGDGEFNQLLRFDAGTGFNIGKSTSAYISLYTGINNRTESFSEEWHYGIEGGIELGDEKIWLIGRLFGIESFKNGATAETITSTSIFANNSAFTSASLEVNYYITRKFGVSANVATAFRGEIIAAAPAYSVGVYLD